jgi:hypothetical protein
VVSSEGVGEGEPYEAWQTMALVVPRGAEGEGVDRTMRRGEQRGRWKPFTYRQNQVNSEHPSRVVPYRQLA